MGCVIYRHPRGIFVGSLRDSIEILSGLFQIDCERSVIDHWKWYWARRWILIGLVEGLLRILAGFYQDPSRIVPNWLWTFSNRLIKMILSLILRSCWTFWRLAQDSCGILAGFYHDPSRIVPNWLWTLIDGFMKMILSSRLFFCWTFWRFARDFCRILSRSLLGLSQIDCEGSVID